MNEKNFKDFQLIVAEKVKLSPDDIDKKTLDLSNLYHTISDKYVQELKILKKMLLDRDQLYGELYHKYKFGQDFHLDTKTEIDTYVRADKSYYDKALEYQQQEIMVKYFEQMLEVINKAGYAIKNYIDFTRLKNGQ